MSKKFGRFCNLGELTGISVRSKSAQVAHPASTFPLALRRAPVAAVKKKNLKIPAYPCFVSRWGAWGGGVV
eukprot:1395198-Amorphochlora_amoeboformis.AAC.1